MANPKPSGLARFTRQGQTGTAPVNDGPSGPGARGSASLGSAVPDEPVSDPGARGAPKPKLVGVYVMPDGHRQLKVEAAKRGATVSDLVREALNAWFANEHLPPLA